MLCHLSIYLSSRVVHPSVVEYFRTSVQGAVWYQRRELNDGAEVVTKIGAVST